MISLSKLDKILFMIILLFSIIIVDVNASSCNGTIESTLTLYNERPYNDIGSDFNFRAYYNDKTTGLPLTGNNTLVILSMQNTTYNMTYNNEGYWEITITSNIKEDVLLDINASNDYYKCRHNSFITKYRTPFYVTFQLYKESLNSSDPKPYLNDFQYVVIVDNNDMRRLDMASLSFNSGAFNLVNGLFSWTGTTPASSSLLPADTNTYLWGNYINGGATIKVYEPSNYSVYVMSNKVQYPNSAFWEFQRPTIGEPGYLGNVVDKLRLYNATNVSATPISLNNSIYKISLSRFEANFYFASMNLLYIILIIIVYVGITVLLVGVLGDSSFGWRIIIGWLLVGGSIGIGLIYALPR